MHYTFSTADMIIEIREKNMQLLNAYSKEKKMNSGSHFTFKFYNNRTY